ncbi:MAG TPA: nitronate monooxygenase [Blastocatellia bacterium]|nr:nitronate monooxygenase [Blastocatellia bacterium]
MWNITEVTKRLGISYPIIQGPFGGNFSTTKLLATVSNAGGLGSFGAHHMKPDEIRNLVVEIRKLTQKPFAINLWVSDHDKDGLNISREIFEKNLSRLRPYFQGLGVQEPGYPERFGQRFEEQIDALIEMKPPVFSFIFGIPSKAILSECRKRGIVTVGTATTVDEAIALDEAQVDLIVASGFEAGGHRASFLRSAEDSLTGTFALVPQVVDRVKAPVIAAGGIADRRGVAAALALGAQAVQIGTAFLACEESGANDLHRAKLFEDAARYTALTRVFTGRLARGIRNRFMEEMEPFMNELPPYPAQAWFTSRFKQAAVEQGRGDLFSLWSGQAAPLLRYKKAGELMRALTAIV